MDANVTASAVNTIWTLVAAALVFFMQAGFAMVETGFTRAKNAGNIIMKNLMDFCIGTPLFFLIGFGIMFGAGNGFFGWLDPGIQQSYAQILPAGVPKWAYVIFQTVFCATSATIVSGAMAERTKFISYCIYSACISGIIYPITGHWIWGGGWLSQLGFHDFAGSTAVHMVGGICALIGAMILGPRIGKYDKDGNPKAILGHSLTLGALGCFILWFCWFGFNGGSTVSMDNTQSIESAGLIFMNTNIAAAVATCTAMIVTWVRYGKPDISMTLNASLAGLVAITAGCDTVTPVGASLIGILSGVAVIVGIELLDKKAHIDDPVGAVGVHCVNGALGTLLVGLFAKHPMNDTFGENAGLFYGGGFKLLGVQLLGVLTVAAFVAVMITIVFQILKHTVGLRCSAEEELRGLDITEHGIASSYADFMPMAPSVLNGISEGSVRAETAFNASVEKAITVEHMPAAAAGAPADKVSSKPDAVMTQVVMIFNQNRFEALKNAMNDIGVTGMTVTNVLGCGTQKGRSEYYRGVKVEEINLLPKIKLEMVISEVPTDTVIAAAKKVLYTGHIGDGKIFVYDVRDVVKVRTGETGYDALQGDD
ncbi:MULTISPECIES: ammonium transporter [Caproicibacterium]|uniref:Ammonium transporter n=1 Tax=Caproicibacterium argilliputei TaxID=3030016 RepID=A0AA97D792_9FIRM|nr:ammonium transporter [Caproicibacterium argilliputei]WOC31556.1 ammonium transporter [Caproicibacterium argilliputei]